MADARGNIRLEGLLQSEVLGAHRVLRGFAGLDELAAISVPFQLAEGAGGIVEGHQREVDPEHVADIQRYIESGPAPFLPEVILSLRIEGREENGGFLADDQGIKVGRARGGLTSVTITQRALEQVRADRRIRRIDGNHRLSGAGQIEVDPARPRQLLAPFALILLGPVGDRNDDYLESLIFHTINTTPLLLDSEHALKLILGQEREMPQLEAEFRANPRLHLTRLLHDRFAALSQPARARIGNRPLTVVSEVAGALIAADPGLSETRERLDEVSRQLADALSEMLPMLAASSADLVASSYFPELAALTWQRSGGDVAGATATLEKIGTWLGRDGLVRLAPTRSFAAQVLELYGMIQERLPRRVFLARWYPVPGDGAELEKANRRLAMIQRTLEDLAREGIVLELDDPGTRIGGTFPIRTEMYDALRRNDIILIDLSGVRPNVCVEAGYALQHQEKHRLLFIFQRNDASARSLEYLEPPFDLNDFRYEAIEDSAQLLEILPRHLREIWRQAGGHVA